MNVRMSKAPALWVASSSSSWAGLWSVGMVSLPYQKMMFKMMTRTPETAASLVGCWYHGSLLSVGSWRSSFGVSE